MTTIFYAWPYGRSLEIKTNLRREKLRRMNKGSNFPGGTFSYRDNVRVPIQFRRESLPQHLKRLFFFKNRPHIFPPVLLDRSNETCWVFLALKSTSHFLSQSTVSCRSDSSSEANYSFCNRSDAWSHLE